MEEQTRWRFEVNNPLTSRDWLPLWGIDQDQLVASQELRDELNRINAPVQLRIVRSSDQERQQPEMRTTSPYDERDTYFPKGTELQ
jgi:hypothetical protein